MGRTWSGPSWKLKSWPVPVGMTQSDPFGLAARLDPSEQLPAEVGQGRRIGRSQNGGKKTRGHESSEIAGYCWSWRRRARWAALAAAVFVVRSVVSGFGPASL